MKTVIQHTTKDKPTKEGWYDTDKGRLYWFENRQEWSCQSGHLSEEYPMLWYEDATQFRQQPTELSKAGKALLTEAAQDFYSKLGFDKMKAAIDNPERYIEDRASFVYNLFRGKYEFSSETYKEVLNFLFSLDRQSPPQPVPSVTDEEYKKTVKSPCYYCQGGGCPDCQGYGHLPTN